MSGLNLAATPKEEQDKVAIELAAELVAREQPEHLREYFWERLRHYRQLSTHLQDKNVPGYANNEDAAKK